ncbi:hypothetical protein [Photorhabdus luminescens]|uniref:Uncharacterized protein n=1 Tax=Photorhabdus luminescens subsp. mexicana TaxID=2100167 RepID=A0A4R4IY38_PHOLU|nr:hypothetical protein [Photorhabdus luminescens]TDB45581.1 hypothetical protein C5468_20310 [Photorhabdus luminescens subsp. mexicana]
MVNENISFLNCAISIETRVQSYYNSPFSMSAEDRRFLKNKENQNRLIKAVSEYDLPVFVIGHDPERKNREVDNFVRHDSFILRLALLVLSVRLNIHNGTRAQSFYWMCSEEAVSFIERLDDMQTIDAIIRGELYFKPVRPLTELAGGDWSSIFGSDKSHMELAAYLQLRYEDWSN